MARAVVFEEHASVLRHWWAGGVRGATLVCLDAHLDLQFVDPAKIARLAACGSAAEFAALESPHPLSPRREACYGIEDFLYPAAKLGLVRRLLWVAPPHVLAGGLAGPLQALQQMEGVTPADLASFQRGAGGWLEGRLLGLELVVGELDQLRRLAVEDPLLVDIDADYFVQVPQDQVWAQPAQVVAALRRWLGKDHALTISRSVGTGFLPLRHRFLADQLAALWEGREEDARHWQALLDLELDAPDALASAHGLAQLLEQRPDCAAAWHALALATGPGPQRAAFARQAATLDPHYGDDLLRRLCEIRARAQSIDLQAVAALQREVKAWDADAQRRATAWIALGLLYAAFGQRREAAACDAQAQRLGGSHPDLALQLGRLELAAQRPQAAVAWFERAAADDETRLAAWYHLAQCAAAGGDSATALRLSRRAQQAAPAWERCAELARRLARAQPGYDAGLSARSSVG